jgi:phosphatidylinositol alpha 1,6-mannosyltransferase
MLQRPQPERIAMRVLYCTDTYPPQVNGVSVVTALSVAGLSARGWECAVVAPRYPASMRSTFSADGDGGTMERERTTLASIPMPGYAETRLCAPDYPAVARAVRRFAPDLVHAETEFMAGRLGQIAAARAGIPIVTSYHTDFAKYTAAYGVPRLERIVSRYISRFHRRALRTYTPSAPAREYLHSIGVQNVEVWGRGVDTQAFAPSRRSSALRNSLGADRKFVFLYAGRLAAEKGVDVILRAFAAARAALPASSVHLVIAGGGPLEGAIRASASADMSFLGYLDRARLLPELYASCDAFLFSSTTETLGLVVLEAMASGLPVIATPAGGVADHLRDEENGLAFPPHDAAAMAAQMVRLAQDRALATRLGASARHTAEALSWELEYDRLDCSYRELLEQLPAHAGIATRAGKARMASV